MALGAIGNLLRLARKVDGLFQLQTQVRDSIGIIEQRLGAIENRMTKLEAEQTQIITEARSASTTAATMIAGSVLSETVTRITRLEGRADQLEAKRLPPPDG